eukprot:524808_1
MSLSVHCLTPWTRDMLIEKQKRHIEEMKVLHSNPILPDNIDDFGNLPELQCGWKKCGRRFQSKDALLRHVREFLPHPFVRRFHVNCKQILETNPDLSLREFERKVKDCYEKRDADHIKHAELVDYYNKLQTVFKEHQFIKDATKMPLAQKEKAEILLNYRIESQHKLMEENQIPEEFPQ